MSLNSTPVHDLNTRVLNDNDDKNFTIEQTQHIPQSFLDSLRQQKANSMGLKEGEYMNVASVPVAVHTKWLREGFDMMKEPAHAIVARLKQENLDDFITTKKRV